jgi:hypothetical protein
MGIGRMIERAGEAAGLPFPVHGIRPDTHWRPGEWIHAGSSTSWGMPRSRIPYATRLCRRNHSRTSGAEFSAPVTLCRRRPGLFGGTPGALHTGGRLRSSGRGVTATSPAGQGCWPTADIRPRACGDQARPFYQLHTASAVVRLINRFGHLTKR